MRRGRAVCSRFVSISDALHQRCRLGRIVAVALKIDAGPVRGRIRGRILTHGAVTKSHWVAMKTGLCSALVVTSVVVVAACGGSAPPVKTSKSSEPSHAGVASQGSSLTEDNAEVPERCIKRKGACLPPVKWAEKLCQDVYPDVALYMFRKGSPWERFYMRTGLNAVNGWGSTIAEDLVRGEEVIPINYRGNKDGFVVQGSEGTFDVLRWNGSCVTLDLAEVTKDQPGAPKVPRIEWRALSEPVQEALMADNRVASAVRSRQKECRGATIGRVTAECERLDRELGSVIARYVRDGGGVPLPPSHP